MSALQQPRANVGLRITAADIARLAKIADRESGIELGADKADFLNSRLSRIVEAKGLADFAAYCSYLESRNSADVREFVEAITTHTTSFFRERGQFDWLQAEGFEALYATGAGKTRDLVIWSAASSTGQELYSAMICAQSTAKTLAPLRYRGVGTDISTKVVAEAKRGIYMRPEITGIPAEIRPDCLLSSKSNDGRYRIVPELRNKIDWRVGSLTNAATLQNIDADVAFLRNVLIYFDDETQIKVIRNVLSRIRPGGYLLTGHSETSHARALDLEVIKPTIYRKA